MKGGSGPLYGARIEGKISGRSYGAFARQYDAKAGEDQTQVEHYQPPGNRLEE